MRVNKTKFKELNLVMFKLATSWPTWPWLHHAKMLYCQSIKTRLLGLTKGLFL